MLRVCRNEADAEDVLVDSYWKAWNHLEQLRDDGSFAAWLVQIGRRLCWRLRRRQDLPIFALTQEPIAGEPTPEQEASVRQLQDAMHSVLAALPPKLRVAYELGELQELTGPEAAQQLRLNLATYKSRLLRAKQIVRERMNGEIWK